VLLAKNPLLNRIGGLHKTREGPITLTKMEESVLVDLLVPEGDLATCRIWPRATWTDGTGET
jgi:hypothetical protein